MSSTQQRTTGNDTENFQDNDPAVQGVPTQQLQPASRLTNIIRDLISNRPDAADIVNDLVSSFDAVNVAEPGRDPSLLQTPTAAAFYDAMRLDNMGLDDFQRQQIAAGQLPVRERAGSRAFAPPIVAIAESRVQSSVNAAAAPDDEMLLGLPPTNFGLSLHTTSCSPNLTKSIAPLEPTETRANLSAACAGASPTPCSDLETTGKVFTRPAPSDRFEFGRPLPTADYRYQSANFTQVQSAVITPLRDVDAVSRFPPRRRL